MEVSKPTPVAPAGGMELCLQPCPHCPHTATEAWEPQRDVPMNQEAALGRSFIFVGNLCLVTWDMLRKV